MLPRRINASISNSHLPGYNFIKIPPTIFQYQIKSFQCGRLFTLYFVAKLSGYFSMN